MTMARPTMAGLPLIRSGEVTVLLTVNVLASAARRESIRRTTASRTLSTIATSWEGSDTGSIHFSMLDT